MSAVPLLVQLVFGSVLSITYFDNMLVVFTITYPNSFGVCECKLRNNDEITIIASAIDLYIDRLVYCNLLQQNNEPDYSSKPKTTA